MNKLVRVAHLTTAHTAFDSRILYKECMTLAAEGYQVVLVVPHDKDEQIGAVQVRAVPRPHSRRARMLHTAWQVYRAAIKERADIYHFHDPELIPVGMLLRLRGRRVIYDVHENLPHQVLNKYWIPRGLRVATSAVVSVLEGLAGRVFTGIVAATPTIASRFPPEKTSVVQNFPRTEELQDAVGSVPYASRAPWAVYVGSISTVRGIKEAVAAMGLLPDSSGIQLVLAGSFAPASLEAETRLVEGWERVQFLGWQSRDGVMKVLREARVGLVTLHPTPSYLDSYPVKLFEYMAAGVPVVASDFPLWRSIIAEAQCGLLVDPLDPKAIADAIAWLITHPAEAEAMGRNGRSAVLERYSWDAEGKKLTARYRRTF